MDIDKDIDDMQAEIEGRCPRCRYPDYKTVSANGEVHWTDCSELEYKSDDRYYFSDQGKHANKVLILNEDGLYSPGLFNT